MQRLVLASQSPRRRELLERAGYQFTVVSVQISEIPDENLNLEEQVRDLAVRKAMACIDEHNLFGSLGKILLSADTVVALDGQMLGKPKDQKENHIFLRRLSGQKHQVITAISLLDLETGQGSVDHDVSQILFRDLSDAEIAEYVATGEGLDKAGGYGIQGAAGKFVAKLEGDFDNVVGLPLALLKKQLEENGWDVERNC
jgi:septum formation protein